MSTSRQGALFSLLLVLAAHTASAWPWNSEPQPVVIRDAALTADAGSPLAWDDSLRTLFYYADANLWAASWTRTGFVPRRLNVITAGTREQFAVSGPLLIDPGLHALYVTDGDGLLTCIRPLRGAWVATRLGTEPGVTPLAVDPLRHAIFSYDSAARGLRRYALGTDRQWHSELIVAGLDSPGDLGAFDSATETLYSTHAQADSTVPRRDGAPALENANSVLQPWPLLETKRRAGTWSTRVIRDTGVPQLPAIRATDRRVFFVTRGGLSDTAYFQPARGAAPETDGVGTGWAGDSTFEDRHYAIKKPQYPSQWGYYGLIQQITISTGGSDFRLVNVGGSGVALRLPITVVPFYTPVWQDESVPARVAGFRSLLNPRQHRLVQNRLTYSGETVRTQVGKHLVGYYYRDADGALATAISINVPGSATPVFLPPLGVTYDPINPPAALAQLGQATSAYTSSYSIIAPSTLDPRGTFDPDSPFVPTELRLPTLASLLTFGHDYLRNAPWQFGGRYRVYDRAATSLAFTSGMAIDRATGVTFYTQAPLNTGTLPPTPTGNTVAPDFARFTPEPQPKDVVPTNEKVWIVMVY